MALPGYGTRRMAFPWANRFGMKATSSYDQTVQVWNIQPRRFLGIGMRHEKHVMMVAFDPREDSVLSASVDQTARLWNARTGQQLGQPMHHQGTVRSAEFSADGRR